MFSVRISAWTLNILRVFINSFIPPGKLLDSTPKLGHARFHYRLLQFIIIQSVDAKFIHSFINGSTALSVGPWPFLQFRNLFYTNGRTPWTSYQLVSRPLPTHMKTQTQNKHTQTSMLRVGLEPMIPVFEREKTVHALNREGTAWAPCSEIYWQHR
jgi:hypothetical protein